MPTENRQTQKLLTDLEGMKRLRQRRCTSLYIGIGMTCFLIGVLVGLGLVAWYLEEGYPSRKGIGGTLSETSPVSSTEGTIVHKGPWVVPSEVRYYNAFWSEETGWYFISTDWLRQEWINEGVVQVSVQLDDMSLVLSEDDYHDYVTEGIIPLERIP